MGGGRMACHNTHSIKNFVKLCEKCLLKPLRVTPDFVLLASERCCSLLGRL